MRVTEKLKSYKPKSLAQTIFYLVFIVLLILTGSFAFFTIMKFESGIAELHKEQMRNLVLAYSEMLDGDSIELDIQRRQKNVNYDKWNIIIDSLLKKTGVKYFYVMNASYNDSIEIYLAAEDHLGKSEFLEKMSAKDFDIDIIEKLKNKSATNISKINYYSNYGGWLIYSYEAVKNSKGEVVAFVGADREILDINNQIRKIAVKLLTASVLFFIAVFLLIIYLIKKVFILPIANIVEAADNFHLLNVSFKNLGLTRIKEYDVLIESFRNMENKINQAVSKSFTDELTKLNNRYFFTLSLENILKPRHEEKKIAFLIIDIDSFKQINDNYGHEKGDFVLRTTGIILKQVFGGLPGVVVRLGGDEFAVCLDNIGDRQIVEEKCNILKEELSQITYAEAQTGVSVSIGAIIAKFSKTPPIYTEIFSAADNNLYKVKAKGKNSYLISEI